MTDATPEGQTELGGDDAAEMTEILDLDVKKMSAVGLPANGTRFLVMKAQAEGREPQGLFEAAAVRELAKEQTVSDTAEAVVVKADGAELDSGALLAEPADGAPTLNPDVPGSPGWEAIDSATAAKVANVLARTKAAIQLLADRERVEAATGAELDSTDAWNLEDANDAIDFAISVVAPFALSEALEAEAANGDMDTIMKAAAAAEGPLAILEYLAPVQKAGRTLSAANESAIRAAIASLTNVINTLPAPTPEAAPAAVAKSTKETTVTDTPTDAEIASPELAAAVAKSVADTAAAAPSEPVADVADAEVTKAKGDPMVAVYDEEGALVGMVKPTDITPIQSASKGADDTPSGDAAPVDLTPAPADVAGTPADALAPVAAPVVAPEAVAKSAADEPTTTVAEDLQALVAKAVKEAREEDATALREQAEVIKGLQDRVTEFGQAEATPKVLTNGATIPGLNRHSMGGPVAGSPAETAERGAVLKSQLSASTDATEQKRISDELNAMAMAEVSRLHGRKPQ